MYLLYTDESGSTGLNLDDKQQPFFVLAGVVIEDRQWHIVNDLFEKEKVKIYSNFDKIEIHTNELFNSNKKSHFFNNYWKDNLNILERVVNLVCSLNIKVIYSLVYKPNYKKAFGNNIIVDPYLYSFATFYKAFNNIVANADDYGIIFCDELKKMENDLKLIYPHLKKDNKNIIEKTYYLNSKENNFIQIADICAFYINKYNCIINNISPMDNYKKEHCLRIYQKLHKYVFAEETNDIPKNYFDDNFLK